MTATLATAMIVISLFVLGSLERSLNLKRLVYTYEVTGNSADEISVEVNQALEKIHAVMANVQIAPARNHVRLQFDLSGTSKQQEAALRCLTDSPALGKVTALGPADVE